LVTVATAPAQQGAVEVSEKAWTAAPATEEYKRSSSGPGLGWDSELVAASSDQAAAGSSSYRSVLGEARAKLAMVEKRALEELRTKVAAAEAKAAMNQEKGEEKATQLEQELKKLEDELRDSAAIEVALFSIVAEHVRSPHKLHTPARRLARLYVHTFRNRSSDRCINSAKNYAAGLIVAIRACGNDVSRFVDIVPRSCCTHQLEYKAD
jgi:exonuclease VII large subunit